VDIIAMVILVTNVFRIHQTFKKANAKDLSVKDSPSNPVHSHESDMDCNDDDDDEQDVHDDGDDDYQDPEEDIYDDDERMDAGNEIEEEDGVKGTGNKGYPYPQTYKQAMNRTGIKGREKKFKKVYMREKGDLQGFFKRDGWDGWIVEDQPGQSLRISNPEGKALADRMTASVRDREHRAKQSFPELERQAQAVFEDYLFSERKVTAAQWNCVRIGTVDAIEKRTVHERMPREETTVA
jgi:hypothetical protein